MGAREQRRVTGRRRRRGVLVKRLLKDNALVVTDCIQLIASVERDLDRHIAAMRRAYAVSTRQEHRHHTPRSAQP